MKNCILKITKWLWSDCHATIFTLFLALLFMRLSIIICTNKTAEAEKLTE